MRSTLLTARLLRMSVGETLSFQTDKNFAEGHYFLYRCLQVTRADTTHWSLQRLGHGYTTEELSTVIEGDLFALLLAIKEN